MANFLDEHGLNTLWTKIKNTFVSTSIKVLGKTLATDFTLLDNLSQHESEYMNINSLSVFENKSVIASTSSGDSSRTRMTDSTINLTIPSVSVGKVYKYRFNRGDQYYSYVTLNIKLPTGGTYIGKYSVELLNSYNSTVSPSYISPENDANEKNKFTDEAKLHIINENFEEKATWIANKFSNEPISQAFPHNTSGKTITGSINAAGGTTIIKISDIRFGGNYGPDDDESYYENVKGTLWIYRIS